MLVFVQRIVTPRLNWFVFLNDVALARKVIHGQSIKKNYLQQDDVKSLIPVCNRHASTKVDVSNVMGPMIIFVNVEQVLLANTAKFNRVIVPINVIQDTV